MSMETEPLAGGPGGREVSSGGNGPPDPPAAPAGGSQDAPSSGAQNGATTEKAGGTKITPVGIGVAAIAIVVWMVSSVFLMFKVGTSETEWTRLAWIFGSIQAVAFAGAGALFGTSVQRERTASAENRAEKAETKSTQAQAESEQNRLDAAKGRILATALVVDAKATATSSPHLAGMGPRPWMQQPRRVEGTPHSHNRCFRRSSDARLARDPRVGLGSRWLRLGRCRGRCRRCWW